MQKHFYTHQQAEKKKTQRASCLVSLIPLTGITDAAAQLIVT